MNDQDFMALNDEVKRLEKLHERAEADPALNFEQRAAIEVLRRVTEYKDD